MKYNLKYGALCLSLLLSFSAVNAGKTDKKNTQNNLEKSNKNFPTLTKKASSATTTSQSNQVEKMIKKAQELEKPDDKLDELNKTQELLIPKLNLDQQLINPEDLNFFKEWHENQKKQSTQQPKTPAQNIMKEKLSEKEEVFTHDARFSEERKAELKELATVAYNNGPMFGNKKTNSLCHFLNWNKDLEQKLEDENYRLQFEHDVERSIKLCKEENDYLSATYIVLQCIEHKVKLNLTYYDTVHAWIKNLKKQEREKSKEKRNKSFKNLKEMYDQEVAAIEEEYKKDEDVVGQLTSIQRVCYQELKDCNNLKENTDYNSDEEDIDYNRIKICTEDDHTEFIGNDFNSTKLSALVARIPKKKEETKK